MKYYTDGFQFICNPSPKGGGYTIVREDDELIKREEILKSSFTNNEAEALGVYNCLKIAEEGDTISTDSQCILWWVRKGRSKARPDLNVILTCAKTLMNQKKIDLIWEPREKNLAGIYNEMKHFGLV